MKKLSITLVIVLGMSASVISTSAQEEVDSDAARKAAAAWGATRVIPPPEKKMITSYGKSSIEVFCQWNIPTTKTPLGIGDCISTANIRTKCPSIATCADMGYYPVYGPKYQTNCSYSERFSDGKIYRECIWNTSEVAAPQK